jgi:glycosyl transferase family 25
MLHVISLPKAQDRRLHMQNALGAQSIPYVFFDALNGEQAQLQARRMGLQVAPEALSLGELGCLMSHVCLWQQLVDSTEQTMAIAEDDIFLGRDARVFFTQDEWIPAPAVQKIVKLEKHQDRIWLGRRSWPAGEGRQLRILRQDHWGAAAYVVGREAATQLLEQLRSAPIERPVDHLIFDDFRLVEPNQVFQLLPAVAIQDKVRQEKQILGSDLEVARSRRLAKREKPSLKRVWAFIYWSRKWGKIQCKVLAKRLDFV